MKFVLAVLCLAAVASASSIDSFRQWSKAHNKLYTLAEEPRRFAIFKENAAIIERLNIESEHARFALNKFSDLTVEEFGAIYASGLNSGRKAIPHAVEPAATNENKDYSYMLPAVKDQAQCGSCWAFSAVANMEGQTYKAKGEVVVSLSEQQLVSCDKSDSGCNGGLMTTADAYAVKNGMTTESEYPYKSGSGSVAKCDDGLVKKAAYHFSSYEDFQHVASDQTMINHIEKYGPISVGIAAATSYFQSYTSGVLTDPKKCGTDLDHGVTLVGYGTENGVDYWLVRNSWGKSWGQSGYVKMIRGKDMCCINDMVSTIVA